MHRSRGRRSCGRPQRHWRRGWPASARGGADGRWRRGTAAGGHSAAGGRSRWWRSCRGRRRRWRGDSVSVLTREPVGPEEYSAGSKHSAVPSPPHRVARSHLQHSRPPSRSIRTRRATSRGGGTHRSAARRRGARTRLRTGRTRTPTARRTRRAATATPGRSRGRRRRTRSPRYNRRRRFRWWTTSGCGATAGAIGVPCCPAGGTTAAGLGGFWLTAVAIGVPCCPTLWWADCRHWRWSGSQRAELALPLAHWVIQGVLRWRGHFAVSTWGAGRNIEVFRQLHCVSRHDGNILRKPLRDSLH